MFEFYLYNPDAIKISRKDFIKLYSASYFSGNERLIKGIRQSNIYVEEIIEDLLHDGIWSNIDVMTILAWKTGKIDQKEYKPEDPFQFYRGWEDIENCHVRLYGSEINMKDFCEYVVDNFDDLKSASKKYPQAVLDYLEAKAPKGIGTVYFLTFLYFISEGYYPIYDRFADKAIAMIDWTYSPIYKKLPSRKDADFREVISKYICIYWNEIDKIFGLEEYRGNRDIDRALWVYGHRK